MLGSSLVYDREDVKGDFGDKDARQECKVSIESRMLLAIFLIPL